MKKLILFASFALALSACNPSGPTDNSNADSTTVDSATTTDTTVITNPDSSTDPSINPDSIQASMKMSTQMSDTTNKL